MPKYKDSPEERAAKQASRKQIQALLGQLDVSDMSDLQELFREMVGGILENGLEAELDEELGYSKYDYKSKTGTNSRNGHSRKMMKTSLGDLELAIPRDREGEFEPQLVKKQQTTLAGDIEEKIISMYAKGMTTNDIAAHIMDIYGLEVSDSTISRVTDKILPVVKEWQQRPLEIVYAVVFMDAIHSILNGMKNRGLEDILIACVDGLTGFPEAIQAVYPKTEIQQCIIHQIRNSTRYVSYKDIKALVADLKAVCGAVDEQTALYALDEFAAKWDSKYPKISKSWREHWPEFSTYFKYPQEIRTIIYTTNAIENFNRQLRKVTKNKAVFPNDDALLKMLYLAAMDITRKWTGKRKDWARIHAQLEVFFGDRIPL